MRREKESNAEAICRFLFVFGIVLCLLVTQYEGALEIALMIYCSNILSEY